MEILEVLEHLLHYVVETAIVCFEFMGVLVIVLTGLKGIWGFFKKDSHLRLNLVMGMALGLEFTLGSEILHTIVARGFAEIAEIATVAAIIVLRVALTILIHWEIKAEKAEEEEELAKESEHSEKTA